MYGKNVVTNASATVTPNEINDNIQHNNKVYLYDFRFISNDKTIYLKNGDVAYHIKLENGTEKQSLPILPKYKLVINRLYLEV